MQGNSDYVFWRISSRAFVSGIQIEAVFIVYILCLRGKQQRKHGREQAKRVLAVTICKYISLFRYFAWLCSASRMQGITLRPLSISLLY